MERRDGEDRDEAQERRLIALVEHLYMTQEEIDALIARALDMQSREVPDVTN